MQFKPDHIDAFKRLSGDLNSLHINPSYSRSTPFGEPVVYGMAGVLAALGLWSAGRRFHLRNIKCDFRKPLFQNQEYTLCTHSDEDVVTLQWMRGPVIQSQIEFTWTPSLNEIRLSRRTASLRESPAIAPVHLFSGSRYYSPLNLSDELLRKFDLELTQLEDPQLYALVWASYFVGMECPGQQALFSSLEIDFSDDKIECSDFKIENIDTQFDERFNLVTISANGTCINSLEIKAFVRPQPVFTSLNSISKVIIPNNYLKDKTVLVTGGSRGFGAILSQAFALKGSTVLINYRTDRLKAESIVNELKDLGIIAYAIPGDVADYNDLKKIRNLIAEKSFKLDIVINNASPKIENLTFLELGTESLLKFIQNSVRCYALPFEVLLPILSPDATIIQISSLFSIHPESGFSHYAAAKSAIEGMTRGLAAEFKKINFKIVRPARMLTDQTNSPFLHRQIDTPLEVAKKLLDRFTEQNSMNNYEEWDL